MTDQSMTARWHVAQDGDTLTVCIDLWSATAARRSPPGATRPRLFVALHNDEFTPDRMQLQ